ncbi:MAG: hypothetical protein VKK99_06320 [Cyanobacteriota bacterium]|nr:hypothetical protein [Cyanobacteriota bacterium]
MFRSNRSPRLAAAASLLAAAALALPGALRAETLYTLDSFCSVNGTDAVPCRIEAINSGEATEYRHTLGGRKDGKEVRFRVIDQPYIRIELWDTESKNWRSARNASAFFALNALCLDGTSFCAINPNYLNSVRQDLGRAVNGRSVLEVHFGKDGRIDASCYDAGCPDGGQITKTP